MSMTRVTVPVDPRLKRRIEAAAAAEGRPVAQWVRYHLRQLLDGDKGGDNAEGS